MHRSRGVCLTIPSLTCSYGDSTEAQPHLQGRSAPTCPTEAGRATLFLSSRQAVPPRDMHVMDDMLATYELGTHFAELSSSLRH